VPALVPGAAQRRPLSETPVLSPSLSAGQWHCELLAIRLRVPRVTSIRPKPRSDTRVNGSEGRGNIVHRVWRNVCFSFSFSNSQGQPPAPLDTAKKIHGQSKRIFLLVLPSHLISIPCSPTPAPASHVRARSLPGNHCQKCHLIFGKRRRRRHRRRRPPLSKCRYHAGLDFIPLSRVTRTKE
jgi:hypothetical protein